MQMAQVAATVANGGTLMQPTFQEWSRIPTGARTEDEPEEQSEVMSEETAASSPR